MLSARWFATVIARRARRTHSARQMHTFIESICPQGHNLLFFIFISFMALVERYLSVYQYLYTSKSEFHICRILFYGNEKQCRKSSPVYGRSVVCILDCYTSMSSRIHLCYLCVQSAIRNRIHTIIRRRRRSTATQPKMMIWGCEFSAVNELITNQTKPITHSECWAPKSRDGHEHIINEGPVLHLSFT